MKDHTPALGATGALATLTLSQWSDLLSMTVGLLSAAYLIRQHLRLHRKKR